MASAYVNGNASTQEEVAATRSHPTPPLTLAPSSPLSSMEKPRAARVDSDQQYLPMGQPQLVLRPAASSQHALLPRSNVAPSDSSAGSQHALHAPHALAAVGGATNGHAPPVALNMYHATPHASVGNDVVVPAPAGTGMAPVYTDRTADVPVGGPIPLPAARVPDLVQRQTENRRRGACARSCSYVCGVLTMRLVATDTVYLCSCSDTACCNMMLCIFRSLSAASVMAVTVWSWLQYSDGIAYRLSTLTGWGLLSTFLYLSFASLGYMLTLCLQRHCCVRYVCLL